MPLKRAKKASTEEVVKKVEEKVEEKIEDKTEKKTRTIRYLVVDQAEDIAPDDKYEIVEGMPRDLDPEDYKVYRIAKEIPAFDPNDMVYYNGEVSKASGIELGQKSSLMIIDEKLLKNSKAWVFTKKSDFKYIAIKTVEVEEEVDRSEEAEQEGIPEEEMNKVTIKRTKSSMAVFNEKSDMSPKDIMAVDGVWKIAGEMHYDTPSVAMKSRKFDDDVTMYVEKHGPATYDELSEKHRGHKVFVLGDELKVNIQLS